MNYAESDITITLCYTQIKTVLNKMLNYLLVGYTLGAAKLNDSLNPVYTIQTGLTTGCIVYTNIYPVVKPD